MACASNAPRPMSNRYTHTLTRPKITSFPCPWNRCIMNHHGWLLVRYTGGQQAHTNADVAFR